MSVGTHPRVPSHVSGQRHPKRVSPSDSVCIRKSPSAGSSGEDRADSDNLSVASNIAANGEEPSSNVAKVAPSAGNDSARTWFDNVNENVSGKCAAKFYGDDDPPFFLRNKSSSEESATKAGALKPQASDAAFNKFPAASSRSLNRVVESSSEDFRSVIDDLTIENRRLRKKLQKYEQLHCGNLQNDKLFEIRVHGLPASKKRRLERTLQDFASSLGDTNDDDGFSSAFAHNLSKVPSRRLHPMRHASSSSTSNSRPLDSAYVSMSTSGGMSDSRFQKGDAVKMSGQTDANDQNVRSYLQTISQGLLPRHPPVMTEKAKKQLVVQRLEQLFTGSRDIPNHHSQSRQQQEVSQSAANADRRESEARGHRVAAEGSREAKIRQSHSGTHDEEIDAFVVDKPADGASSRDTSTSGTTPDQRPTRPLDLDPSRAQNPEENIEYMKHLGFDPPSREIGAHTRHNEGWVYLNLLVSMAQLHTLNVTPEYVRTSVREISAKFDLSADGSRIRWKGGNQGTKLNVESGDSSEHSSEPLSYDLGSAGKGGRSKSSKPSTEERSGISANVQSSHEQSSSSYNVAFDQKRPLLLGRTTSVGPHEYRPIFYHAPHEDQDASFSFDGKDSPRSSGVMESNSAFEPDGARYGQASKVAAKSNLRKGVDPIIFYNRARFYTDLSKDEESMPYNCPLYNKLSDSIVGCQNVQETEQLRDEGKGLMSQTLNQNPMVALEHSASSLSLTGFSAILHDSSTRSPIEQEAKPLDASGIGGVMPGDNFAIDVRVRHTQASKTRAIETQVVSARRTDLLPSALPPPSYAFLPFSSGSTSDDGTNDDESDDSNEDEDAEMADVGDIGRFVPPKFLHTFSSNTTPDDVSSDGESDDSSIDLLAHARQMEPEEVAAREREFEENASSVVHEMESAEVDPPASSVVATVGEQSVKEDAMDMSKEFRRSGSTSHSKMIEEEQRRRSAKHRSATHGL